MKVKDMKTILSTNKFDNAECNFKLKTGKQKLTLEDVMLEIKGINFRLDKIENRLDTIENRLDNVVAKNNLKE